MVVKSSIPDLGNLPRLDSLDWAKGPGLLPAVPGLGGAVDMFDLKEKTPNVQKTAATFLYESPHFLF